MKLLISSELGTHLFKKDVEKFINVSSSKTFSIFKAASRWLCCYPFKFTILNIIHSARWAITCLINFPLLAQTKSPENKNKTWKRKKKKAARKTQRFIHLFHAAHCKQQTVGAPLICAFFPRTITKTQSSFFAQPSTMATWQAACNENSHNTHTYTLGQTHSHTHWQHAQLSTSSTRTTRLIACIGKLSPS